MALTKVTNDMSDALAAAQPTITSLGTIASLVATTADINGGTIDGATVDGRNVGTDGTKLDGIEASADVTTASKIQTAGGLLDSELTSIVAVKALNQGVATGDSPDFAALNVNGTATMDALTVEGSASIDQYLTLKTTDDQANSWVVYTGTTDKLEFNYNGSGNAEVVIDSSGHLLVGTSQTDVGYTDSGAGASIDQSGVIQSARSSVNANLYLNKLDNDGEIINLRKDGITVGSVNTEGGDLAIGNDDVGLQFINGGKSIRGFNMTTNARADAAVDLGMSSTRFKNLYLSSGVYLGGTGAANKLDDYEEGTWTSLNEVTGGNCTNIAHSDSYYTKVGRLVTLSFKVAGAITSASAETNFKFNLPFAAINSSNQGAGGTANLFIGSGSDRFGVGSVFNGTTSNVTSHIYIPSSETSDNGTFSDMRVFMSYITP